MNRNRTRRPDDRIAWLIVAGWVVSLLLCAAVWGVGIWAVIELVQWIKTK